MRVSHIILVTLFISSVFAVQVKKTVKKTVKKVAHKEPLQGEIEAVDLGEPKKLHVGGFEGDDILYPLTQEANDLLIDDATSLRGVGAKLVNRTADAVSPAARLHYGQYFSTVRLVDLQVVAVDVEEDAYGKIRIADLVKYFRTKVDGYGVLHGPDYATLEEALKLCYANQTYATFETRNQRKIEYEEEDKVVSQKTVVVASCGGQKIELAFLSAAYAGTPSVSLNENHETLTQILQPYLWRSLALTLALQCPNPLVFPPSFVVARRR